MRCRALALALPVVALTLAACSSGGHDAAPAAGASSAGSPISSATGSPVSSATAPTPAGRAEARTLSALPTGHASGTAVIDYSGAGELRAPFSGDCSRQGDTTRIQGSADTARIDLRVAPDGARLSMDDVGVSATSALATGRYDVSGRHLSLSAPLTADGVAAGAVQLEVDCGG